MPKPSPGSALARLRDGNARFAAGEPLHPNCTPERREVAAAEGQAGLAVATVLACSDSRVPVERVFDTGIADLFVVRVAGNVCTSGVAASVEFGMTQVRTPLLVVLGHTGCGAVAAAAELAASGEAPPEVMRPVIERVMPSVEGAPDRGAATEANVRRAIEELMDACPGTRALVDSGRAEIAGGVYDLKTGVVSWLGL
ncbi:MAG: carbonic anhydrase [Planctomycetota bacterium]|jgi:carbonic anhydrase